MGTSVTLGKAFALLATVRCGHRPPVDEIGHAERVIIFKAAARYALIAEEVREILQYSEEQLRIYLKGLLVAGLFKVKSYLPLVAGQLFQTYVFNPTPGLAQGSGHSGSSWSSIGPINLGPVSVSIFSGLSVLPVHNIIFLFLQFF